MEKEGLYKNRDQLRCLPGFHNCPVPCYLQPDSEPAALIPQLLPWAWIPAGLALLVGLAGMFTRSGGGILAAKPAGKVGLRTRAIRYRIPLTQNPRLALAGDRGLADLRMQLVYLYTLCPRACQESSLPKVAILKKKP